MTRSGAAERLSLQAGEQWEACDDCSQLTQLLDSVRAAKKVEVWGSFQICSDSARDFRLTFKATWKISRNIRCSMVLLLLWLA